LRGERGVARASRSSASLKRLLGDELISKSFELNELRTFIQPRGESSKEGVRANEPLKGRSIRGLLAKDLKSTQTNAKLGAVREVGLFRGLPFPVIASPSGKSRFDKGVVPLKGRSIGEMVIRKEIDKNFDEKRVFGKPALDPPTPRERGRTPREGEPDGHMIRDRNARVRGGNVGTIGAGEAPSDDAVRQTYVIARSGLQDKIYLFVGGVDPVQPARVRQARVFANMIKRVKVLANFFQSEVRNKVKPDFEKSLPGPRERVGGVGLIEYKVPVPTKKGVGRGRDLDELA